MTFLALHQHGAVRIDFGDRHADFSREGIGLSGLALSIERLISAHIKFFGLEK
jgi:hypothetical protein